VNEKAKKFGQARERLEGIVNYIIFGTELYGGKSQ
jgi:hypothetical protein